MSNSTNTKRLTSAGLAAWVGLSLLAACDRDSEENIEETVSGPEGYIESPEKTAEKSGELAADMQEELAAEAEAELEAAEGQEIEGEVHFFSTPTGVRVVAEVEEASAGPHGFHIHEKGDCSDIPGKSMGGHWAPRGHDHALPDETEERHLGDLGNLNISEEEGRVAFTMKDVNLKPGDERSLLGKAVVVHAGEDSGKAKQPAGDSGKPIACGVIKPQ